MEYRMAEYKILLAREFKQDIHQYLIYVGAERMTMPDSLETLGLSYRYTIINLQEIDAERFLQSDVPEELILAILCKFPEGKAAPEVIHEILEKLRKSKKYKTVNYEQAVQSLEILSKLRNLQAETIQQINDMPIHYDIKTDLRFLQGKKEGIEKGIEKGQERDISKLLLKKILTEYQISEGLEVPLELVQSIKERLIESGRLTE